MPKAGFPSKCCIPPDRKPYTVNPSFPPLSRSSRASTTPFLEESEACARGVALRDVGFRVDRAWGVGVSPPRSRFSLSPK